MTRLAQLAVFFVLLSTVASAQPLDLDTPADSPLWWTLTDDISPQQLRETYHDAEANRQRFRQAVAAGLQPPAKYPDLRYLEFYVNPRLTPELVPMWLAFQHLATVWVPAEGDEGIAASLAARGVSIGGIERVLAVAAESAAELRRRFDEIGPLGQDFIRMQWEILDRNGWSEETKRDVEAAVERADVRFFSERTGRSEADVAKLIAAGKDDSYSRVPAAGVVQLKKELSPLDWQGLRRYLFDRAASDLAGMMDTSG